MNKHYQTSIQYTNITSVTTSTIFLQNGKLKNYKLLLYYSQICSYRDLSFYNFIVSYVFSGPAINKERSLFQINPIALIKSPEKNNIPTAGRYQGRRNRARAPTKYWLKNNDA